MLHLVIIIGAAARDHMMKCLVILAIVQFRAITISKGMLMDQVYRLSWRQAVIRGI